MDNTKEEPQAVIIWEVMTGQKKRSFHCENASVWPIFKCVHLLPRGPHNYTALYVFSVKLQMESRWKIFCENGSGYAQCVRNAGKIKLISFFPFDFVKP